MATSLATMDLRAGPETLIAWLLIGFLPALRLFDQAFALYIYTSL